MARKGKFSKKPSTEEDNKNANFDAKRTPVDKYPKKFEEGKGAGPANPNYAGLIFMCNDSTKMDCYKYRVFGLPDGKKNKDLVEQVRKGMRLFLFDLDLRLLYGIYTASSRAAFKLERDAFGGAFPWQVRFTIQKDCLPLSEDVFKAAIKENYMDNRKFKVELTAEQVQKLVKLFHPLPGGPVGSPLRPRMAVLDCFDAPPKTKAHKFLENDRHIQDRRTQGYLPPRAKYEPNYASDDLYMADRRTQGYLPPRAKNEPIYASDDLRMADRHTQGYLPPRANHEHNYASDDLSEARLQWETPHLSQMSVSLPLYGADSLRPLSELQKTDPYQIRARDQLYSAYPQRHTPAVEVDSVYRHRLQIPEVRGDLMDRRLLGLDSLVDSSTYAGGLSSEILRGRPLDDTYMGGHSLLPITSFLHDGTAAFSSLSFSGEILPQSTRRYVGGGW